MSKIKKELQQLGVHPALQPRQIAAIACYSREHIYVIMARDPERFRTIVKWADQRFRSIIARPA
jgi:hypothetical protein